MWFGLLKLKMCRLRVVCEVYLSWTVISCFDPYLLLSPLLAIVSPWTCFCCIVLCLTLHARTIYSYSAIECARVPKYWTPRVDKARKKQCKLGKRIPYLSLKVHFQACTLYSCRCYWWHSCTLALYCEIEEQRNTLATNSKPVSCLASYPDLTQPCSQPSLVPRPHTTPNPSLSWSNDHFQLVYAVQQAIKILEAEKKLDFTNPVMR